MTFNLRYDNPEDGDNSWSQRKEAVKSLIRHHRPTVLCTQEGLSHMLEWLSQAMPEYTRIGSGREADGSGEHTAIFVNASELGIPDSGQFWISPEPERAGSKAWNTIFPRCCTWCRVSDKAGDDEAVIFNVHLDNRQKAARLEGGAILRKMIRQVAGSGQSGESSGSVVLCGDFNAFPDSEEVSDFCGDRQTVVLRGCEENRSGTYHGFQGTPHEQPIDYILTGEQVAVRERIVDNQKYGGHWPSDHFPVIAQLDIPAVS